MTWFAIFDDKTGRLESIGEIVADDKELEARGLVKAEIQSSPADNEMWDESSRSFIERPAKIVKDKLDDVLADPLIAKLSAETKGEIAAVIDRIFLDQRKYNG